jgi:acetamidase/formamidase
MTHHHLKASPQNCHWGYFDATRAPVLTVASGDQVTIDTVSGAPGHVPSSARIS